MPGTSEVGGENGAERRPPPGIQAQRPRTRTARTTRQINGAIFVQWLGRFLRFVFLSETPASNVQQSHLCSGAAFCHTYKLILTILEAMDLASNTNVNKTSGISAIFEFMVHSIFQNVNNTQGFSMIL